MKLHRVLLFTSIQMDITPVGKDLHVLLTSDNISHIGSTVYAKVLHSPEEDDLSENIILKDTLSDEDLFKDVLQDDDLMKDVLRDDDLVKDVLQDDLLTDDISDEDLLKGDSEEPVCEFFTIDNHKDPDTLFCRYVAESLAKQTGKNVLCTGGIFTENPTERDIYKLYENVDEMIHDWTVFFTDD